MKLFYLFPILVIASCVSFNTPNILYAQYKSYKAVANTSNIKDVYTNFFTRSYAGENTSNNDTAKEQLLFKNYMAGTYHHYESIHHNQGCLTVTGFDKKQLPVAFNIRYKRNHEKWLIDKVTLLFFTDNSKLPDTVSRACLQHINAL